MPPPEAQVIHQQEPPPSAVGCRCLMLTTPWGRRSTSKAQATEQGLGHQVRQPPEALVGAAAAHPTALALRARLVQALAVSLTFKLRTCWAVSSKRRAAGAVVGAQLRAVPQGEMAALTATPTSIQACLLFHPLSVAAQETPQVL